MRTIKRFFLVALVSVGLVAPVTASASDFTPSASLELTPRPGGSFYTNAFKSANWAARTGVSAPPTTTSLLPTRNTTLRMPPESQMTFNPGSMPVCPDSEIGPGIDIEVPIEEIVARCPDSIVGNGDATFLLGRTNQPDDPSVSLTGVVLAFNGGLVDGRPKVKFWAYSYDTSAGIYTEGVLQADGTLDLPIPVLTADSAVNRLDVYIPGVRRSVNFPVQGFSVTLPAGQKSDYVQAKCDTGTFPFSADFLFGRRTFPGGVPLGPPDFPAPVTVPDVGEDESCTGISAVPRLAKPTISGPSTAKVGKVATYKVTVRNTGGSPASGVRLRMSGRGVTVNASVGTIPGESSRTVTVKAKFRSKGTVKATFTASSSNGGTQKAVKTIRVR